MSMLLFFFGFLMVVLVFQHQLKKNMAVEEKTKQNYWEKERESLVIRKKELQPSDFISVDLQALHLNCPADLGEADYRYCQSLIEKIRLFSEKKLMNYAHLSNADLRLKFGTANQDKITAYEENYNQLLKLLGDYGMFMRKNGEPEESIKAFELCVNADSDYSNHYKELAELYLETDQADKIEELITKANGLSGQNRLMIQQRLDQIKRDY